MRNPAHIGEPRDQAWRDRAACKGSDLDWFPTPTQDASAQLAVCRGCRVIAACRRDADATEAPGLECYGIRGGETPVMRMARRGTYMRRRGA
ncbi:WhiB family transcriptional regulator [Iamia majanohamensis]|uniref:WhiB family transcriptional regulator n=1 Tax=Iamia majanohamensis TaxID=467976 RepID=UPI003AF2EC0D